MRETVKKDQAGYITEMWKIHETTNTCISSQSIADFVGRGEN